MIKWLGEAPGTVGQTRYQEYDPRTGAAIGALMTEAEYRSRSNLRPFTRVRVVVVPFLPIEKHRVQLSFHAMPLNDLGWFYGPVSPYPGAPATTAAFRSFICKWFATQTWWNPPASGISVFVDGVRIGGEGLWKKWDFCTIVVPGI